jgi:hypothetical protein
VALSTYDGLLRGVIARCPTSGYFLAGDWIRWAFREVTKKGKWSWLIGRSQFLIPNQYTTGTANTVNGQNVVTGNGTNWTASMIGYQFRIGLLTPIYTITAVNSATSLTLDDVWGGTTQNSIGYQIYYCYLIVPSDFHSFTAVWDPNFSWRLWTDNIKQEDLALYDGQRAAQGTPYVVADFDYTSLQVGGATISPPLPRYELWPHQQIQYVIPFTYEKVPPDLDDANATLPRYIDGNVLMEGALSQCARWPGPDSDHRNPYFNLPLAQEHSRRFNAMVEELWTQDQEVYNRTVFYEMGPTWPMAPLPFPINSGFLQLHAI